MEGRNTNDYILASRKSFVSNDNDKNMIEKNFIEIKGTFLLKIHDNAFKGIDGKICATSEWFTTECIGTIATWDELVERFTQKFYNLFDHDGRKRIADNCLRGPYANTKPNGTFDCYLDTDCMYYEADNVNNIQEGQGYIENLIYETSACKIRKFEMMKYTFEADEEYVANKELINHSETNVDARCAY
ncbi:hypothetical protein Tco_0088789 [Tanacetum coccineum]